MQSNNQPTTLTPQLFNTGLEYLCKKDSDLAKIYEEFGPPPLWDREPDFPTLIHIILEQQVSLASAKAAFDRLCLKVNPLTPEGFLFLNNEELKTIGFSRQKTGYGRNLAKSIIDGTLDLKAVNKLPDRDVRKKLITIKGIGNWTIDIYLLMGLLHPDVWPDYDIALAASVQRINGLKKRPDSNDLLKLSEKWKPYRSIAARLFWHFYLNVDKT